MLSSYRRYNRQHLLISSDADCITAARTMRIFAGHSPLLTGLDISMLLKRILILLIGVVGTAASAASFDCKLAQGRVEVQVCADSGLARRDEELAAVYTSFLKATSDRKSEKAMQLAWLRIRDACEDAECIQRTYDARIAELQARIASASPIVGYWKIEHSCAGATGVYGERCKKGERDVFTLAIQMDGDRVCVAHLATAQLHNRVDGSDDFEMSMEGNARGGMASVRYRSGWGGTGTATLRVDRNTPRWKVETTDEGRSWIPDAAELRRVPARGHDSLPKCAWQFLLASGRDAPVLVRCFRPEAADGLRSMLEVSFF